MTIQVDPSLFAIRSGVLSDKNFIMASWLRGLRYGNRWFGLIVADKFFKAYQNVIEAILSNPNTRVNVVCLKEDPDVILGYCVYSDDTLHWVFIKKAWRKIGLANAIVPKNISTVTHLTSVGESIIKKKNWEFNPFLN